MPFGKIASKGRARGSVAANLPPRYANASDFQANRRTCIFLIDPSDMLSLIGLMRAAFVAASRD